MSQPLPVVVVDDPRPGGRPASQVVLPDGRPLDQVVVERATAEAGAPAGSVSGAAGVGALIADRAGAPAAGLALVDAATLALPTTYGDVVADPRDQPAVLHDEASGRVVAVRLDPATLGEPGVVELLGRALRGAPAGSALTVLGGALAASGRPVRELTSGAFPVHTVLGQADLAIALVREAAVDEAALRLRRASRADDGFLSTFLVRPLSRPITRRAVALGLRPDAVTAVSFGLGLLAAAAYAGGGLGWRAVGSLLLLLSLVVDCVDGEVARYTRTFSPVGGWLDIASDRVKEYAVYAGLAYGVVPHAWGLAAAAFAVLVSRHFIDFGYAAMVSHAHGAAVRVPGAVAALSERTSTRPALLWAKRAVIMPVGERTIALAVLAPALGSRAALWVLLVAGCVAAAYTLVGRLGRMLARGGGPVDRLGWLGPALARVVEQGGLALLVGLHRPSALPAAYLLLAAVAFHQYDVVYRSRLAGADPERARTALDLVPWPARVVVVAGLTLVLGAGLLGWVLTGLGATLGLAAVADSVVWWRAFVRSGL